MRNAHRWRLLICADYVRRLSGRLLPFYRPVETITPPQWWRWAESNRRPERFQITGITTVFALWAQHARQAMDSVEISLLVPRD